ncbi:hypothetical protein KY308_04290 [Candidatus Woesearchaeota archaeon]|nr:hypothetical protein [Candidatus Woesearchaeota archaeon]
MVKNHMKRISAPRSWNIRRKKNIWITAVKSSHKKENSIPVAVLLRDMLKHAKTLRDVNNIMRTKTPLVNGSEINDTHLGIGVMDIFEIPEVKEKYVILLNRLGKLIASKTKSEFKISKIMDKKRVGKKTQLNFYGGGNVLVDKDVYKTGDSVAMGLADKKIKNHYKFEEGANCFLTGGGHIGEFGKISKIEKSKVIVKVGEDEFETLKKFIYVTGKEELVEK